MIDSIKNRNFWVEAVKKLHELNNDNYRLGIDFSDIKDKRLHELVKVRDGEW